MSETRSKRRRLFDALTTALLAGAFGVVLVAATPAILRAAGLDASRAARPVAPAPRFHDRDDDPGAFVIDDSDDDHDDGELPGPGMNPRGDDGARGEHPKVAHTRGTVRLHDTPEDDAPVSGAIKSGEAVLVFREEGRWVLVGAQGSDGLEVGWVKKSEILVR